MARRSGFGIVVLLVVGLTMAALTVASWWTPSDRNESVLTDVTPPLQSKGSQLRRNISLHVGIVIVIHHHAAPRDAAFLAGTPPTAAEVSRFHALTLDGALVLRRSILSRTSPMNVHKRRRRCWREFTVAGDPVVNSSSVSLFEPDGECTVPVHQLDVPLSSMSMLQRNRNNRGRSSPRSESTVSIRLRFVALVTPSVSTAHLAVLRRYGYETWATNDSVVDLLSVASARYRRDVVNDGALGFAELLKLKALHMGGAGMFDTVVVLDSDVMFHQSLTELLRECLPPYVRDEGDDDEMGGREERGSKRRMSPVVLHWTRGGIPTEPINGGYLIFSPRTSVNAGDGTGDDSSTTGVEGAGETAADLKANAGDGASSVAALRHYDSMLGIVRRGNYTADSGWEGSGVGRGTHGGRTIQGLLPYYFLHVLGGRNSSSREIDRCRFNNMVQLPRCQALSNPASDVVSNHFTGGCLKPWKCFPRAHPLCARFVHAWLQEYQLGARDVLRSLEDREQVASPSSSPTPDARRTAAIAAASRVRLTRFLDGLDRRDDSGDCLPSENGKVNRLMLRKLRGRRDLAFVSLTETLLNSK